MMSCPIFCEKLILISIRGVAKPENCNYHVFEFGFQNTHNRFSETPRQGRPAPALATLRALATRHRPVRQDTGHTHAPAPSTKQPPLPKHFPPGGDVGKLFRNNAFDFIVLVMSYVSDLLSPALMILAAAVTFLGASLGSNPNAHPMEDSCTANKAHDLLLILQRRGCGDAWALLKAA